MMKWEDPKMPGSWRESGEKGGDAGVGDEGKLVSEGISEGGWALKEAMASGEILQEMHSFYLCPTSKQIRKESFCSLGEVLGV